RPRAERRPGPDRRRAPGRARVQGRPPDRVPAPAPAAAPAAAPTARPTPAATAACDSRGAGATRPHPNPGRAESAYRGVMSSIASRRARTIPALLTFVVLVALNLGVASSHAAVSPTTHAVVHEDNTITLTFDD